MKRNLAQDISKCSKEINTQVKTTCAEASDVGFKLLKNNDLSLEDINELGQCIAEKEQYDKNQLIVCDITELNKRLELHKDDDISEKPIFVICCNGKNPQVSFCIVKLLDETICLYRDFLDRPISETIKNILKQHFCKNIQFKIHAETENATDEICHDVLSLKTVETMMVYLKPDKKKDFIEDFANPENTFFEWLKNKAINLKKELFSYVEESYYKTVASDIDLLSRDAEFKKAIKEFINSIPLDEADNFEAYQNVLKEFAEIEENASNVDISKIKELEERLKKAREKAFPKTKKLKIEMSKNENNERELDIVKNYPTQMKKFTKIFQPLTSCEVDEELDKMLDQISSKLDLDYKKLKSFFKTQEKVKPDDNCDVFRVTNIEDVINSLPKGDSDPHGYSDTNKTFKQIISEITLEKSDTLIIESLEKNYFKVKDFYKLWNNEGASKINQWAFSKKGQLVESEVYEALALMGRANELVTGGHKLRDTQILSILVFLQQKSKGQLTQIQTGEGKTTIVSILSAIKALQGKTVDVVTSNPVLASEGVKNKKTFYDLLGLSVATNNLDENYKSGARECYKADIVYGSISSFQFDYLKDSFLGLSTRAGRPFDIIILDEVDSMIIDNASHIAKLSTPFPGMENLKYIYINIWKALYKAEEEILQDFQKQLQLKAQELEKLPNSKNAVLLYEQFQNELQNSIIQKIKDYIRASNPTKVDIIPSHIQQYANNSLDRWINSAIDAKFNYHEDEQYVLRYKNGEKVIQPVDYANTGITLRNTIWQYGLHQFLQLKHNLHLTSESLTSCFISNLGYINKYGDQIFGLTGTLGSEAEQELLSSIYNVGFAKIPTYREKKFTEDICEVVDDEIFSVKVADNMISKLENGRATLIVCETIRDAKAIEVILQRKNITIKMFLDEENVHITEEEIKPGEVVIATNIAGRGTDFKTSAELENNHGLHVCVAFLPCNKRVEDQAFGRTARQGKHGTAQLIIRKSELEKLDCEVCSFEDIKNIRDQREKERIQQIKEIKIPELKFQDEIFELFSNLYRKLQKRYQNKAGYKYVLDDLKEFWAFWLEKKNFKGSDLPCKEEEFRRRLKQEFSNFEFKASEIIEGRIQFNAYYSIQQAEYFISSSENLDKAEGALNHAITISKNPEILHSAYIKFFEIEIEKGRVFIDKCKNAIGELFPIPFIIKSNKEYKDKAKNYLAKAKRAFKKELDYIETLLEDKELVNIIGGDSSDGLDTTLSSEPQNVENLFLRHLVSKQQALNLYMDHISKLIEQVDKFKGGISIGSRISDYFSKLEPQNDLEVKIKKNITNSELSELAAVGVNTVYTLKEVPDVCKEVIQGAQLQIGGGIALIAVGCAFPPAFPVACSIGSTMITEGICDVVFDLIDKNSDGEFNKEAYIKGKVISYGISLLTMGVGALMQCPKILNAAKRACRWLSKTLRKCRFLKGTCEFLANKIDKLGNWFEKMEVLARFAKMNKVEKLNYVDNLMKSKNVEHLNHLGENINKCHAILKELKDTGKLRELTHIQKCVQNVVISTSKAVAHKTAETIIMSKVITPGISSLMSKIKKHVEKSVRENIDLEKLKCCTYEDIEKIIKEINEVIDHETVRDIFRGAILDIAKNSRNLKIQLAALAIGNVISWKKVYDYSKDLCKKINDKLPNTGKSTNKDSEELLNQLIEQISKEMLAQAVDTTINTCKDAFSAGKSV